MVKQFIFLIHDSSSSCPFDEGNCQNVNNTYQAKMVHFQINGFHGVLQTSGFLAPGKKYGQLEVYNEDNYQGWDKRLGGSFLTLLS